MSFKTCKKLSFDCTLNKLDINVTFKCILPHHGVVLTQAPV